MSAPVLQVILGSTRPGRAGEPVARWFCELASRRDDLVVEPVDLAEVALPFFDEPELPRTGRYVHEHTRRWSRTVDRADAFVFVTPEYNHGPSAVLKNAIDFLHAEWAYKPVGLVSYGGIAAGTRAAQVLKQVVLPLRMTPVLETVAVPLVHEWLDGSGTFVSTPLLDAAADLMLSELHRVSLALRPLRN